ncbi:MAG: glycogen debranching protein [Ruminiclostridium sp.]|nr:glycogen debranching protein [Ruminiclostridium sp.]
MEFGKSHWPTYEQGIKKEWLLTNGMGGFSASTIIGANTRRYHGLLTASLKPPVRRHLILSKVDESIEIDGESYNLYSFSTGSFEMKGFHHLQRAIFDPLPVFIYSIGDVTIQKTVSMVYGENTVIMHYRIINGGSRLKLRLAPLVNFRDYHHLSHKYHMRFNQTPYGTGTVIRPYDMDLGINLSCTGGTFMPTENSWFQGMFYHVEQERGLDCNEDHYIPGWFDIFVEGSGEKSISFTATIEKERNITDVPLLIQKEKARLAALIDKAKCRDKFAAALTASADNFIVCRESTGTKTIIAGYPWFTDWGRDSLIALCGLTLVTGRFYDAEQILLTFSRYIRYGLVPNMFPDEGQEPGYNSVDAALWYFEAVNKFLKYTENHQFIRDNLYESMKQIIQAFIKGTIYKIGMDDDSLITAGDQTTQLTWMDARVGSRIVTPRHGKAVEINALWYNALKIISALAEAFGDDNSQYAGIAVKVKDTFVKSFWNENEKCLYDTISDNYKDGSIRPNQIIALSLSYPVLDGQKARAVVEKVWKELYTSYGLRSLSRKSENYRGVYAGDQCARDGAYHQGTVWVWPAGHFITAFKRVYGDEGKYGRILRGFIAPFEDHLKDACVGSISEIFDGDEPLTPRGCFAQAWSVGEILRAYIEDVCKTGE